MGSASASARRRSRSPRSSSVRANALTSSARLSPVAAQTIALVAAAIPVHRVLRPRIDRRIFAERHQRMSGFELLLDEIGGYASAPSGAGTPAPTSPTRESRSTGRSDGSIASTYPMTSKIPRGMARRPVVRDPEALFTPGGRRVPGTPCVRHDRTCERALPTSRRRGRSARRPIRYRIRQRSRGGAR